MEEKLVKDMPSILLMAETQKMVRDSLPLCIKKADEKAIPQGKDLGFYYRMWGWASQEMVKASEKKYYVLAAMYSHIVGELAMIIVDMSYKK